MHDPDSSIEVRLLLIALVASGATAPGRTGRNVEAAAPSAGPISLVGRWRVFGGETSPLEPADCGRGQIVFTADHVTIDVPAAEEKDHAYTPLSASPTVIAVRID